MSSQLVIEVWRDWRWRPLKVCCLTSVVLGSCQWLKAMFHIIHIIRLSQWQKKDRAVWHSVWAVWHLLGIQNGDFHALYREHCHSTELCNFHPFLANLIHTLQMQCLMGAGVNMDHICIQENLYAGRLKQIWSIHSSFSLAFGDCTEHSSISTLAWQLICVKEREK